MNKNVLHIIQLYQIEKKIIKNKEQRRNASINNNIDRYNYVYNFISQVV